MEGIDIQAIVRQAVQEYAQQQQQKTEPAYKTELVEERKRREQLERRLNELVEENKRSRQVAEEAQRGSAIRAELQRLGVAKVDLAFKAVQDGVVRTEDGRLRGPDGQRRSRVEGIPGELRQRESGIFAGADPRRVGHDDHAEGARGRARDTSTWIRSGQAWTRRRWNACDRRSCASPRRLCGDFKEIECQQLHQPT